ncbi:MAG: diaminopimelate epimerase [Dehalococcoidia bacterium]|nr:MAG: diaminopimelate epimerase [Dehalococcoidia bacterium]
MNFTKMQAAGNDFILIEAADVEQDWSALATAICDRHFGVGGDGLLLVLPSAKADLQMREFNPDGSETEACGNGLRCVAKYAAERGLVGSQTRQMGIETIAGIRQARLITAGGRISGVEVSMGKPKFGAADIPISKQIEKKPILDYPVTVGGRKILLNLVSMGNPHAVCFWQDRVSSFPLPQLGRQIEHHRLFPRGVNFEVANILNPQRIEARVWERGVGETLACGSGACAITVIAQLHGLIGKQASIKLAGGILDVTWDGVGEVMLSGPAEVVFSGQWSSEV